MISMYIHSSIIYIPPAILDNPVFVIAGGTVGGALLLVVTAVILLCILFLRKVHSTTHSKLFILAYSLSCVFICISEYYHSTTNLIMYYAYQPLSLYTVPINWRLILTHDRVSQLQFGLIQLQAMAHPPTSIMV